MYVCLYQTQGCMMLSCFLKHLELSYFIYIVFEGGGGEREILAVLVSRKFYVYFLHPAIQPRLAVDELGRILKHWNISQLFQVGLQH